jgi:hypothetical protein
MNDDDKTKEQLIHELAEMRRIIAEFEVSKPGQRQSEQDQYHMKEVYKAIQEKSSA